jgi:MoxR-like ATPase
MRLRVGYPSVEEEQQILAQRGARRQDKIDLSPVIDAEQLRQLQTAVEQVHAGEAIERYIVTLTAATRQHPQIQLGVSPRGSLALYQLARAHAMVDQRDFVLPDDVKAMALAALAHRLLLKPELWVRGVQAEDIVRDLLERTPVPKAD